MRPVVSIHIYSELRLASSSKIDARNLNRLCVVVIDFHNLGNATNGGKYGIEQQRICRELNLSRRVGCYLVSATRSDEQYCGE